MFFKIFNFEVANRFKTPAVYVYFLAVFLFSFFTFATGSLPLGEKEHINAPFMISFWSAGMSMMMMLVSSSIMGSAIYRDIEYNTKDYYLTYPITKAEYFWGRYFGALIALIFIALAIVAGIYIGAKTGPLMGWKLPEQYGPNKVIYYLQPFLLIVIPNIIFTASLFFGLIAVTRNIKVIYFGGLILFLFYFLSVFFLNHTANTNVITIADPFGLSHVRMIMNNSNSVQQNTGLIPVDNPFLINRILWIGIGIIVLAVVYYRFSFKTFFSGKRYKAPTEENISFGYTQRFKTTGVNFNKPYNLQTFITLTKIELLNIVRDNYFSLIVLLGGGFLGFVFFLGNANMGVEEYSRTVMLLGIFNDVFPFFIFFILLFYTGETLHRDRVTRYAFINDSLPPTDWVMSASKLVSLLIIAVLLSIMPVTIGIIVQTIKGYYRFNLRAYFTHLFIVELPVLLEMVVFSYVIHVLINNKFAAHAFAAALWIGMFFLRLTGTFNYNMLLYSYTPGAAISDMDGIGHMISPVSWFNLYWTIFSGLLILLALLFYYRGVGLSFRDRIKLARERFDKKRSLTFLVILACFIPVAGYIYYNVSYLNTFLLKGEIDERTVLYEKALKHYDSLPLPKIISGKLFIDLYPGKKEYFTKGSLSVVNLNDKPISQLLLDGDDITSYSIKMNGNPLPYASPLVYKRASFSWFGAPKDTAAFRLYTFPKPIQPGDTVLLDIEGAVIYRGFQNGLYADNLLNNGTFTKAAIPGFGYDEDDEMGSPYERKKNGLPEKNEESLKQDDPVGINNIKGDRTASLMTSDVTISTTEGQTAFAPGKLVKQWTENGRSYFQYVVNEPGYYPPFAIGSAKLVDTKDSIQSDHRIDIDILHLPEQSENTLRFMQAYKDGLRYCEKSFGAYPYQNIRLVETSNFGPRESSMATLNTYAEYNLWNAHFTDPDQFDICYFNASRLLAQQWWRFQVAPNNTVGSMAIPVGLSNYTALMLTEKKYGQANIRNVILDQLWFYLFIRRRLENPEQPLLFADQWFLWSGKTSVALYGLQCLIGEDNMNASLREFKEKYAFRKQGPYPGANDLLQCLDKHVPDSLKYFLDDAWKKITFYDNSIESVKVIPAKGNNEFAVTINFKVNKVWIDAKGNETDAVNMNDYIDLGILGEPLKDSTGRTISNPLYMQQYKFTHGDHSETIIVKGKPTSVAIDPYAKVIDRNPNDNFKNVE